MRINEDISVTLQWVSLDPPVGVLVWMAILTYILTYLLNIFISGCSFTVINNFSNCSSGDVIEVDRNPNKGLYYAIMYVCV